LERKKAMIEANKQIRILGIKRWMHQLKEKYQQWKLREL